MISLNWVCRRILKSVGYTLRIVEGIGRSISNTGSHNESFDTESADELTVANTVFIGLDIALVPSQTEWRSSKSEGGFRRQPENSPARACIQHKSLWNSM